MAFSVTSTALGLAFTADILFRELPNRWHPVAWMGSGIALFCRGAPKSGRTIALAAGSALVVSGAVACAALGWQIETVLAEQSFVVAALCQAFVLKTTFTVKSLAQAAVAIEAAIHSGDLQSARQQLSFHLVSRDVTGLNESQIAAAAIESVAENTSDSVVAPLFYFAIAGLPGALAYRFINTCDAMIGYRNRKFEWLGKPAARVDDLLNLVPARLTAVIMLVSGGGFQAVPLTGVSVWFRDRYATDSPNAGHPMSAAAGILAVELEKLGHYRLGCGQRIPCASDLARVVRMLWATSGVTALLLGSWLLGKEMF